MFETTTKLDQLSEKEGYISQLICWSFVYRLVIFWQKEQIIALSNLQKFLGFLIMIVCLNNSSLIENNGWKESFIQIKIEQYCIQIFPGYLQCTMIARKVDDYDDFVLAVFIAYFSIKKASQRLAWYQMSLISPLTMQLQANIYRFQRRLVNTVIAMSQSYIERSCLNKTTDRQNNFTLVKHIIIWFFK